MIGTRVALLGLLASAFLVAGIVVNSAIARDKGTGSAVKIKVLVDNAKAKAYEASYAPGAQYEGFVTSTVRIVRVLKGGTLERTYADGRKERVVWKAGEVKQVNPGPAYTTKNIGKSELQLYVVQLK